jgi:hypothetical protein
VEDIHQKEMDKAKELFKEELALLQVRESEI